MSCNGYNNNNGCGYVVIDGNGVVVVIRCTGDFIIVIRTSVYCICKSIGAYMRLCAIILIMVMVTLTFVVVISLMGKMLLL